MKPSGSREPGGAERCPSPFVRYDLRTTDPEAAAKFYRAVAGFGITADGGSTVLVDDAGQGEPGIVGYLTELPERARAAGAPAHWLGHLVVDDLADSIEGLSRLGGQRLGTISEEPNGARFAAVRDPQGAVFAVRDAPPHATSKNPGSGESQVGGSEDRAPDQPPAVDPSPSTVAWHQLHTTDLEAAWTFYSELFGWRKTHALELGEGIGTYQLFAWDGVDGSAGAMAETARRPHIHTHWLFHLRVDDIDAAVDATRELGGTVVHGPTKVPGGSRVAACDDPQGGAFGLREG